MSGKDRLFSLIDKGREGKNIGLSIGLPKLELYMDGLLPGTSYLIAAQSGVGKSTFSLYAFVYKPLMNYQEEQEVDRDPYFIMFNLEMTQEQIYAKLLSMYIYEHFGEQITYKELFSRGKDTRLSDDHYELVKQCDEFLDMLDKRLIFHDSVLNSERYKNCVIKDLQKFGTFTPDGVYIPNNKDQLLIVMIDHMSLCRASNGRSKKEEMDLISSYSVQMRNRYNISPVHIMQFNRNANNPERLKQDLQEPDSSDFKDSAAMYEDSHVVIALHSPIKFKRSSYRGYNIKELGHNFIACILLKSRFGTSDIAIGLGYYGDCSIFKELPKADQINDYERFKSPDWTFLDTPTKNLTFTL